MITPPKIATTYIQQYDRLLSNATRLNDSPLDRDRGVDSVMVCEDVGIVLTKAQVTLEANLKEGSVAATLRQPDATNLPDSKISFHRQGSILQVEESALPTQYEKGTQRNFSISLLSQHIVNESVKELGVVTPPSPEPVPQESLDAIRDVGKAIITNGWLVTSPWEQKVIA